MKTLVALLVLVGLALSAPAPQSGLGLDTTSLPIDYNPEIDSPALSARSHLGSNNPVIVKKKEGYRLYRDSTEERADSDPRESCGKQVRVKFCDEASVKSADLRRSTKDENQATHEDDVEDSIKLAKEAVESLQRDLKTIEHGTSGKNAQWKHGEQDKDLHEDIEAARQALEHAQKNFGTLESMNMRTTTLRDSEALNNIGKAKTEEERLAQWKLAMENIQRNVEIASNLEKSFRSAEPNSGFINPDSFDTTKMMRSENHHNKADFHKTIKESTASATSSRKSFEEKTDKQSMQVKSEHHTMSEKRAEEHFGQDMKSAASESVHLKRDHLDHAHHNSKTTQGKLAEISLKSQPLGLKADSNIQMGAGKGIQLDTSLRSVHSEDKMSAHDQSMSSKTMHSDSAHKITLNKEISSRTSENAQHNYATHKDESSSHMKKSFESHNSESEHNTMQQGKSVTKEWESDIANKHLKHEKSAWTESERNDMLMKSAENNLALNTKANHEQGSLDSLDAQLSMKSAEHFNEHKNHKSNVEFGVKNSGLSLHSDMKMKSAEHSTEHKNHKDNVEFGANKSGSSVHTGMKMSDDVELVNDISIKGPSHHGVSLNTDKFKQAHSSEQLKELNTEEARTVYGHGHHKHDEFKYGHGHHGHGHGLEYGHGHGHGHDYGHGHQGHVHHGYGHHGKGYHGKSADFDNAMHPSMQVEMKDFGKSAMDDMLHHHHHDGARSSYGLGGYGGGLGLASGAGGPGAVGVFPNARLGGCAVPLLLSCSPSVVPGSLAKAHGYTAPAYRNHEEVKIKEKRDIIKAKETPKKVKDIPISTKPKDLEKKL